MSREAFGAEFVGAEGFLNSPTYGLPPQFMFDALQDCLRTWQAGEMDVPSFDESVSAGRAGYGALVGVPVDSVAMAGTVSSALGLVAAAIPDGSRVATLPASRALRRRLPRNIDRPHYDDDGLRVGGPVVQRS